MARSKTAKRPGSKGGIAARQALGKALSEQLMVGQRVVVLNDDNREIETVVTNYPWQTGYDEWVIGLEGFGVAYDITRVRPI